MPPAFNLINERCLQCGDQLIPIMEDLYDSRFGIEQTFDAVRCVSCAVEQIAPLPSDDQLKIFYEKFYNYGGERNSFYTRMRGRFLLSLLYRLWIFIDGDISFHSVKGKGRLL